MKAPFAVILVLALLTAGCTKNNNDQKPVYFVPPTANAS